MDELAEKMITQLQEELDEIRHQVQALQQQNLELWSFATRAGILSYKLGFEYVEEAVSEAFGINRLELYVKRMPGRPKQEEKVERLARNVLANILYRYMGYPAHEIAQHYGMSRTNPFYRFANLDMLDGQWDELSEEEKKKYTKSLLNLRNLIQGEEEKGGIVIDYYKHVKGRLSELLCDSALVDYIEINDRDRSHAQ